jgi:hypothetical protein
MFNMNKCKADSPPLPAPLRSLTIASFCIAIVGLVVALAALTIAIVALVRTSPCKTPKQAGIISTGSESALRDGDEEKSGGVDKHIKPA